MREDQIPAVPTTPILCLALACQLVGIPALVLALGLIVDGLFNASLWATWTEHLFHLDNNGAKLATGLLLLVVSLGSFQLPGYRQVVRFFSWRRNQQKLEKLYTDRVSRHTPPDGDR